MPLQNRVLATGEIIAHTARGLFMGNRGILHGDAKNLGRKRWTHKAWVTCVLAHKDWHRAVMAPHRYTELFFLDEAVALAAGHRPCAMCRRADYTDFRTAAGLTGTAKVMDAQMHAERAMPRRHAQRRHQIDMADLPDSAILMDDGRPKLWLEGHVRHVSANGYGTAMTAPKGKVTVLTPPLSLAALQAGYRPRLHPSAYT